MPYTDIWSDAIPADSAAANTVGAQLRQLRLDVHERINTLIGQTTLSTPLADPLMPVYAPNLFIPVWGMWNQDNSSGRPSILLSDGGLAITASGAGELIQSRFPIKLPPGCILGNITAYFIGYVGTFTVVTDVYHLPFSTATIGGAVALGHIGTNTTGSIGTGFQTTTCSSQTPTTIVAGDEYYGVVTMTPVGVGSRSSSFGVLLNYTRPIANLVY